MTLWFTARGAGLSALVLVSASICLGALVSRRRDGASAGSRYVVQYLHRVLGCLGVLALLVHVTTILADPSAGVGWRGAVVPFTSGYRPTWVALGTLALYLTLLAAVLGLARGRLAPSARAVRAWRAVHALSYAAWVGAMLHGFNSGSDSSVGWVRALYLVCLVAVLGATAARVASLRAARLPATGRATPDVRTAIRPLEGARR